MVEDRKLRITHVAFDDGEEYRPEEGQTDIKSEVYVTDDIDTYVEPTNPNGVVIAVTAPALETSWTPREVAFRLENGKTMGISTTKGYEIPPATTGAKVSVRHLFALLVSRYFSARGQRNGRRE